MSLVAPTSAPGSKKKPKSLYGYEVLDTIGEGAGSIIYAASDPKTQQLCALKYVQVKAEGDERYLQQVISEYEVASKANHPGLRKATDLKTNKSFLHKITEAVLVMELVDGVPVAVQRPQGLPAMLSCFIQTAQALKALHTLGYVHCDLKPDNILICSDGQVKIIDLGQAAKVGTKKDRIQGSADFISPEQVHKDAVSVRTDVFNLGATMYSVLTSGHKLPTLFTVKRNTGGAGSFLVEGHIQSPSDINPAVPQNLSNLVMECIRVDAMRRPADMGVLISRLEVVQYGLKQHQPATA